jgi:hypothetical protein
MSTLRSIAPRHNLRPRVDALEREFDRTGRLTVAPPAAVFDRPRTLWPAQTVAYDDDDGYPPPPANKFRLRFVDVAFTPEVGWEDFSIESRAGLQDVPPVAGNLTGCYLPAETLVWVTRRKPLAGAGDKLGEWWIVQHNLVMQVLAMSPTDGIPARSGVTLGRAENVELRVPQGDDADGYDLANPLQFTETIYNAVDAAVAGDRIIKASREAYAGLLIVDLESCGGS